ncbi:DUF4190 domain-containing protein [Amycolatopsis sp. PS_44_ISF1]|uniref:DUF4190 domain-containing protein n=1 Tax=Amycolatopsis sp. PS_44_ISF1 TaxID=2974917 RepID=UPI0028DEC9CE|nr:DUF4190 domain-containing protein [Amycolatopsis sp. PS_44_ISF1]MDT8911060.1 DUF4190 domain-containing protein [Amycolatopsis sp. PS_44_ISF1]
MTSDQRYPLAPARHSRPPAPVSVTQRRAPAKPKPNFFAVVALLCGLAAIAVAFTANLGYLAWPLAGLGLVLAIAGLVQSGRGVLGGRSLAVLALLASVTAALLSGATMLFPTAFGATGSSGLHLPPLSGDKHTVDYVVTSAGGATVRYGTLNDQRTDDAPPSTDQWHGKASYNGGTPILSLTADSSNTGASNQISCTITVDGRVVAENSGTTIALCTANVE